MPNPITVGYSQLSGKIFAGRSKPLKGTERTRAFTGEKFDVTDQALVMVAHKLKHDGESARWELADGSIMTLSVTITPPEAQHG
jgi:hypothetical protein